MEINVNPDTLNSAVSSMNWVVYNNFNSIDNILDGLYNELVDEDGLHDCFSEGLETIGNLQTETISAHTKYLNLITATKIVLQTYEEIDKGTNQEQYFKNLENLLNACFNNTSLGILAFSYYEIQAFNEANGTDFRIQGYTMAGDYYLITAYDKTKSNGSRVYVYDKNGKNIGYISLKNILDKHSHVGGITYDSKNNILFITGKNGVVNSYDFDAVTSTLNMTSDYIKEAAEIPSEADLSPIVEGSVDISNHIEGKTSAATTYYSESEQALYVADCAGEGTLIKYNVEYNPETNKVTYDSGKVVSKDFAACCQGVATYEDANGNNYIYATQSYGKHHDSVIKKYEVTSTGIEEVGATTIDTPGLEGIQIDKAGNVSGVFENFSGNNPNQTLNINVNSTDFSKKLSEIDPSLEEYYIKQGTANKENLNK